MKERFYNLLNIKLSESKFVFDLFTVQFFIGIANSFINIVAFTFFIDSFSIRQLPNAYLVIAVVLLVLNFIYEKLEVRFSPLQLLKFIIGASAVMLVGIWWGLNWGDHISFVFVLLTWSIVIYMLTGYAYWGMVSLLFNIRESKRIFSIIGSGDLPAKLIGYIIGPLLISFIGLSNLLWLSVISMLTGLFIFNKLVKSKRWDPLRAKAHHRHHDHLHQEVTTVTRKNFVNFFFKTELIFTISLLSILSYNVFNLIDFTFLTQVKLKFDNKSSLAFFISIFFASGRIIALVLKLVFTSRVIERFGLISCLFITPTALFLFCLLFFFIDHDSPYTMYVFGFMALLTEVLRSTMQEPVFFILFQPLKQQLRLKGHIISKGYMLPPSLIIVGLSLLFMFRMGIPLTIFFVIKVLLANLVIWAVIIYFIRRAYLRTLHASIRKGVYTSDEIHLYDKKSIHLLIQKIRTGTKSEIIYSLKLLESAGYPALNTLLEEELYSTDRDIRQYAIERLESRGNRYSVSIRELLDKETDPEVRQKMVSMLMKTDPVFLDEMAGKISSVEPGIRKVVIINLLNQREFSYLLKAGNEMNCLINSAKAEERGLAISIISRLKHVRFTNAIEGLINDPDSSVKKSAIIAACKLRVHSLLSHVLQLLEKTPDKYLAMQGLLQYGDDLFLDLSKLPPELVNRYNDELVRIAGKMRGIQSTQFLLAKLPDPEENKSKIIHALWSKEYLPSAEGETQQLVGIMNMYLRYSREKIIYARMLLGVVEQALVGDSIDKEVKSDLISALKICAMLYNRKEVNRTLELIEFEKNNKLVNAIEMLELVLPKKVMKDLNFLFDHILEPDKSIKNAGATNVPAILEDIFFEKPSDYNAWTRSLCIYTSWKNRQVLFLESLKLKSYRRDHQIVHETSQFVLNDLTS